MNLDSHLHFFTIRKHTILTCQHITTRSKLNKSQPVLSYSIILSINRRREFTA